MAPDRARHDLFPAPPTAGILPGSQAADTIGVPNAMSDEPLTAGRIAELLGGTVEGCPSVAIESIAAIDLAGPTDITFAGDDRRVAQLANSQAGAAIVRSSYNPTVIAVQNQLTAEQVQGFVNPALDLVPFVAAGDSHVDYILGLNDQLILEIKVSKM